ncbi:hypothetical protein [Synechococcus lacustris]|uniref:hypothetical protein n=1 Tax=Synechococcus lacustris TaxID=2116544 RepID=UPI00137B5BCB|nr:hypothetical protein [Synechococcus lacustris]
MRASPVYTHFNAVPNHFKTLEALKTIALQLSAQLNVNTGFLGFLALRAKGQINK